MSISCYTLTLTQTNFPHGAYMRLHETGEISCFFRLWPICSLPFQIANLQPKRKAQRRWIVEIFSKRKKSEKKTKSDVYLVLLLVPINIFFCIHCISAAYFQGYPFVKLLLLNLQKLHFSHAKECTLFKVS